MKRCVFLLIIFLLGISEAYTSELNLIKLNEYLTEEGNFIIQIEADKDFKQVKDYFLEGKKYVIDFWDCNSSLSSVNIFSNLYAKEINFWQIQSEPVARVRMTIDLMEGQKPKLQIAKNVLKIIFEKSTAKLIDPKKVEQEKEYRLGAGDIIEISVFDNNELSTIASIPENGIVILPLIGEVNLLNTSIQEATEIISTKLKEYIRFPIVTLKVKEYKSQWVNVMGEVRNPGRYYLKGTTYLLDIIAEAGGFTDKAGSEVVINRLSSGENPKKIVIKKENLSSLGDNPDNIMLYSGDNISIPPKKYFYIYGEVAKPGSFLLEEGITILKAITQAGGFTKFASKKNIEILRTDESGQQKKILINIKDIEERKSEDIEIKPEDIIRVPKSLF